MLNEFIMAGLDGPEAGLIRALIGLAAEIWAATVVISACCLFYVALAWLHAVMPKRNRW